MTQSILVVDDDLDTLALIGLTLQRRGFAVRKAQSGSEALEMLRAELSDLVIADVMMPQMDGYEVCRQIKTDPRTAHLPVVILTAKAQTASQLEGFRAGAIDYITKPVHPQDLVTRITSVLERAKAPTTQVRTNVIAVAGAKGGVGATTLAVNLATVSASHARTILVDLEMSGTAHLHLGLEPQHGLYDLGKLESGPNDPSTIDAVLTQHAAGLRLLASSETAIEPARVGLILNQAVALCDVCVLDLGWGVSQLTDVVAQRSTAFVIAIDSDRAALTQANRLLHALSESHVPPSAIKLVWINRQNLPPEVGRGSIRAVLGRDPDVTIDSAAELLYEALEKGQPLVLSHPDSPTAAQVRQLAENVLIRMT